MSTQILAQIAGRLLRAFVLVACVCVTIGSTGAQTPAPMIALATPQEAAAAIVQRDEYLNAVTAADVSIWLRRPGGVADIPALSRHLAENVRPWSEDERARLNAMIERVSPRLALLASWLPERMQIAAFRAEASGGADFTRGSTIFLAELKRTDDALDERFFHELFHVLSRMNPSRRDEFYAIVGFDRCTPMVLDGAWTTRMVTNPDAPAVEHASRITIGDQTLWATPLMVADVSRYTRRSGLFDHVQLQFIPLRRDDQGRCTQDRSLSLTQAQIGRAIIARAGGNTDYVIHPEELTADNFAQMMMGRRNAPSPEIHDRLAAVLGVARPATAE